MFGPYTPLQLLDLLADHGTKSYVVGSTNSLLLQQKDRYSDILINVRLLISSRHGRSFVTNLGIFYFFFFSSMTIQSISVHRHYEARFRCLQLIDVGSISSPKLSTIHGMKHIQSGRKRTDIWVPKSLSAFSLKSTYWHFFLV